MIYAFRRIVATVPLMVFSSGCYHHHLMTSGQNGNVLPWRRTVNAGWAGGGGAVVPPRGAPDTQSCHNAIDNNGMHTVTVDSNAGYSALSVVTLGAISPVRVTWNCAPGATPSNAPTPSAARAAVTSHTAGGSNPGASGHRTFVSTVWGLSQDDAKAPPNRDHGAHGASGGSGPVTPANCIDSGIRQAKIQGFPLNYLYSVATVGTAGFLSPLGISWQCEPGRAAGAPAARGNNVTR